MVESDARLRRPVCALLVASVAIALAGGCSPHPQPTVSAPPPVIPVGLDAYRMWEKLPYLRIGVRAYLGSTYDRSGGNAVADASHYLREDGTIGSVALDVESPGVLYFSRANNWRGSPWHYLIDGADHLVSESRSANPMQRQPNAVYLPISALPSPLAITSSVTEGADLNWVPMPFAQSLQIGFEHTHYGTGYFIHHQFPDQPDNLSQPLAAWDESPPDPTVVDWVAHAGADLAPTGPGVSQAQGNVDLPARGAVTLIDLTVGAPQMVRALRFRAPAGSAVALAHARLRVTWDERTSPSIDAPIGLFFGSGSFYNRDGVTDLVRAVLSSVRFTSAQVALAFFYPMPFFHHARLELVGAGTAISGVSWELVTEPFTNPPGQVAYFHATYVDHGTPIIPVLDCVDRCGRA